MSCPHKVVWRRQPFADRARSRDSEGGDMDLVALGGAVVGALAFIANLVL